MPYSPTHHYVHVAIPKTGTTSLVRALRTLHEREGGRLELLNEEVTPEFRSRHGLDRIGDPQPGRAKHLSALQLKYIVGDEAFDRCHRFTVVRNPWERAVSRYNYTHERNEPPEAEKRARGTRRSFHDLAFAEWVERRARRHRTGRGPRTQLSKLIDENGNLLVDHIGRLADLQATVDDLCDQLGVASVAVKQVNPSPRARPYADYYDDHTRALIAEIDRIDIEYFGFAFDDIVV